MIEQKHFSDNLRKMDGSARKRIAKALAEQNKGNLGLSDQQIKEQVNNASGNTKHPIFSLKARMILKNEIDKMPLHWRTYYALAVDTGQRVNDILHMKIENFDFEKMTVENTVAKQTRQGATSAERIAVTNYIKGLQKSAFFNGDMNSFARYEAILKAGSDWIWEWAEQQQQANNKHWKNLLPLITEASKSIVTKTALSNLRPETVELVKELANENSRNGFLFDRETVAELSDSRLNNGKGATAKAAKGKAAESKGSDREVLSRQSAWRAFKKVLSNIVEIVLASEGINLNLSIYSFRKTRAFEAYEDALLSGEKHPLEAARIALGHKNSNVTLTYLQMNSAAYVEYQRSIMAKAA